MQILSQLPDQRIYSLDIFRGMTIFLMIFVNEVAGIKNLPQITDIRKILRWSTFFEPAGSNPLLTYIIPFILWALYRLFDFYPLPVAYKTGLSGVLFCLLYASVILFLVMLLNRINIKLQL